MGVLLGVVQGTANAVTTRFRRGFKLLKGRDDRCGAGVRESGREGLCPTGGLGSVAKDRIGYLPEVLADVPEIDDLGDGDAGYAQKRGGTVPDPIRTVSRGTPLLARGGLPVTRAVPSHQEEFSLSFRCPSLP